MSKPTNRSQHLRTTSRVALAALFLTVAAAAIPSASAGGVGPDPIVIHPRDVSGGCATQLVDDLGGSTWEEFLGDFGAFLDCVI